MQQPSVFEKFVGKLARAKKESRNLAVFIDGPNILRKDLNIDLRDISRQLGKFGKVKIGKVFLNQYANDKLLEAVVNQGYESIIAVGDIDVTMATEATEAIFNPTIDAIAFVTRDSDFLPAIIKAKRYGKDTIVLMAEEASAASLKNHADNVVIIGK